MKKTLYFLWFVGLACQVNAADVLTPEKILADITPSLSQAYQLAQKESSKASKNPISKLFLLKDFFLPFIGPMIGINPEELSDGERDSETSSNKDPMTSMLESKAFLALFASENIVERSATHLKYAVAMNFCQELAEDGQASEHAYSICERVVGKNKLFIIIKDEAGMITISVLWANDELARLIITPNSLSNAIILDSLFLLIKDIKPDTSLKNLSGTVGFDFQFTTPSRKAMCQNNAQACIGFISKGVVVELDSGINLELSGAKDGGILLTVEAYESASSKLFVTLKALKLDLPILCVSSAINNLMATITIEEETALLENISKGPGYIDFLGSRITLDINDGKSIPSCTITHDSLLMPASSCCLTATNESLIEKLTATITSPTAKLLFLSNNATSNASCNNDKPLSAFHTGSMENKDAYLLLEQLLKKSISKDQTNATFGVADGTINMDYCYGSCANIEQPTWLGRIQFMMSALDFLKKSCSEPANQ